MEERTYTQKELYQFVAEYTKEANDEGFDPMVGDFVDWVVSREETGEGLTIRHPNGNTYKVISRDELCPQCLDQWPVGVAVKTGGGLCDKHKEQEECKHDGDLLLSYPPQCAKCHKRLGSIDQQQDKPVLPEKLDHVHFMHSEPQRLDELGQKINQVIEYLKGEDQEDPINLELQKELDAINKEIVWSRQERQKVRDAYPDLFPKEVEETSLSLDDVFGAVTPRNIPEDFKKLRDDAIEEHVEGVQNDHA